MSGREELLLGEWAALGALCTGSQHGFAVAKRLAPDGDLGRVWSMSRGLTYRAVDQLVERGLVGVAGEEPGIAGGNRTLLRPTRAGRTRLRRWLTTPVPHLRDLRSELLLKLLIADQCGIDVTPMLARQRQLVAALADRLAEHAAPPDAVDLWRLESSRAALRVLDTLLVGRDLPT